MNTNNLLNIVAGNNLIVLNRILIERCGLKEAIVLRELLKLHTAKARKNQLKNGKFYVSYKQLIRETGLIDRQVYNAVNYLQQKHLIETEKILDGVTIIGRDYKINKDEIDKLMRDGTGNTCANFINEDNYITYNKKVASKIGIVPAIVFNYLLVDYLQWKKEGRLVEGLWFIESHRIIGDKIGVSRQTMITEYMPKLIESGLIWTCTRDKGNFTHISINEAKLIELLGLN